MEKLKKWCSRYDEQQVNKDSDQNVNRVIEKNLGRAQIVVSNRYWIY